LIKFKFTINLSYDTKSSTGPVAQLDRATDF
jgi:hypothetical protein